MDEKKKRKILKWVGIGTAVVAGIGLCVWLGPGIVAALGSCATPATALGAAGYFNQKDPTVAKSEIVPTDTASDLKSYKKRDYTKPTEPFNCSSCIVNLPEGWHASEEKIRTAQANGFDLKDSQTWREGHPKYNHTESGEERSNENGD